MTDHEKIALKNKLKGWGLDFITQRIDNAREAMRQAQEAANSEEKSSAGDKYETGRAMGHLQKDMHARQLAESLKELATLHAIQTDIVYHEGSPGALLQTDSVAFFISAGLGKRLIDDQTIFFLSPQAPLAGLLLRKKSGDSILFNRETLIIREVF
jgi:hypothetical protein